MGIIKIIIDQIYFAPECIETTIIEVTSCNNYLTRLKLHCATTRSSYPPFNKMHFNRI